MIEVGRPLIVITQDGGTGGNPTPDITFNGTLEGTVDGTSTIAVELENGSAVPQTPVSVTLTGNTLTIVIDTDTDLNFNGSPKGAIIDGTPINVNLQNSVGVLQTPISSTLSGNTLTIVIDTDTDIAVNSVIQGAITDGLLINVLPVDSVTLAPITPTLITLAGNTLTMRIASGSSSGVAFKYPDNTQTTIYATGATPEDEGWRFQNGWYDYVAPTNPAKVAELDYSIGANFFYQLKTPLRVGSVLSTTRFVDVDGGQTFSSTLNKNYVCIDKLTGLMWVRWSGTATLLFGTWQQCIDHAAGLSLTVGGVTYNDWYMCSALEFALLFADRRKSALWADAITGVNLTGQGSLNWVTGNYWTATTQLTDTTRAINSRLDNTFSQYGGQSNSKATGGQGYVAIRKCRNLIFAS